MDDKRKVRKQIYLEPDQNKQIKQLSARERKTEAEVIRDAVNNYLTNNEVNKDPLSQLIGMVKDGDRQGSTKHDLDIYLSEKSETHEKE
ncbi:putative DNA-binding protein [Virgibacillus natechei]|uniref:DNA-binding protein n=1 Tax=Virgibacillus natechei TaxID=1216297 RepID=A0ABS4ILA3_9BACI|nr:CopG family transcriptional regulator [Virgibacillus natechei]MBP1971748.1 putative DNA-binding protein [Virgibacillus natechei]UZD12904.1 ribbon-helix-helix domain-containing protein [Virgibacillus natechei]